MSKLISLSLLDTIFTVRFMYLFGVNVYCTVAPEYYNYRTQQIATTYRIGCSK